MLRRGFLTGLWLGICASTLLAACGLPGDAAPVVKIGVIAPFEGIGRPLGYGLLPEVKAAIAEANTAGELGRYRVALTALNDDLDAGTAAEQAASLAQDPAIIAVLGPFDQDTGAAAAQVLAAAGIPALVAAPLEPLNTGVISLCPTAGAIAGALQMDPSRLYLRGDAEVAAEELLRRRSEGWEGQIVLGPDALRSWFIQRAGAAAEGARAAACSLDSAPASSGELPEAGLARAGTEILLRAAAADIRAHRRPTRAGVADALARQSIMPRLRWYQVQGGAWQPLP